MARVSSFPDRQRGLTLVEVLVGIAIGMIAMIVMFQTVTVWDARTRSTAAGSDAQIGGTLAMYSLERDLRLAGLGFGNAAPGQMGCPLVGYSAAAASAIGPFPMVPILIVDGGQDAPDSIATLYGNSPFFTEGEVFTAGSAHSVTARSRVGFKPGDLAVVSASASAPRCHLVQVVDNAASGNENTLGFDNTTSYADFYSPAASAQTSPYNDPNGITPGIPSGYVFNLGPKPRRVTWQVSNGTFGYTDDIGRRRSSVVSEGIVDMKAEYGYDEDGDTRISGPNGGSRCRRRPTGPRSARSTSPCCLAAATSRSRSRRRRTSRCTWRPTRCGRGVLRCRRAVRRCATSTALPTRTRLRTRTTGATTAIGSTRRSSRCAT